MSGIRNMQKQEFNNYSASDFLEDEDFIRYVSYGFPEDNRFWKAYLEKNPSNSNEFLSAELQLRIIRSDRQFTPSDEFSERLWKDINVSISQQTLSRKRLKIQNLWISGLAACMVSAIAVSWFFLSSITIHSAYGENKKIHLPDGSEILLNANSTISYRRAFSYLKRREVRLEGEGYFKVKHINSDPNLIKNGDIFTAVTNNISVTVLGTEFNLRDRRDQARIALVRGKVSVKSNNEKSVIMMPGETLHFNQSGKELREVGMIEQEIAWLSGKILVNQTTVDDILLEFENLYGYQVILEDSTLGKTRIDGAISIKNEQSLLFTLKNLLYVDVIKKGKIIHLKSRN